MTFNLRGSLLAAFLPVIAISLAGCNAQQLISVNGPQPISMNDPPPCHFVSKDGVGEEAGFNLPKGLAVDAEGIVYTSEDHRIRKVTPDGTVTSIPVSLLNPVDLEVGPDGKLYTIDYVNARIVTVAADGTVSVLAGAPYKNDDLNTNGWVDGKGAEARFSAPWGICVDAAGTVFVADTFNHRIRKITPDGTVTTVAGSGDLGGSSTAGGFADGLAATAKFHFPRDIEVDAKGTLYVADTGNGRIRTISPDGQVDTLLETGSTGFHGGLGDVVLDKENVVWFTERDKVSRRLPSGEVQVVVTAQLSGNRAMWGRFGRLALTDSGRLLVLESMRILSWHPSMEKPAVLAGHVPDCFQ